MNYDFILHLTVDDPEQLLQAARAHPDAANIPTEDFYDGDGEIDIAMCLGMVLDPGCTIPGVTFHQHYVETT